MTKQPVKKLIQITIKKVIKRIKMLYEKWKDFDHQKKKENEDLITFHLIQAIAMVFLKSNNLK